MRCYATVISMVLVLLLRIKTGYSLDCDFCYGAEDCSLGKDVAVVKCDQESVQLTNSSLASFIRPLRTALSTMDGHYECVHVRATSVSGHVFLYTRGCVHRLRGAIHFCSLPHAAFQGSLECMACHGEDRCNNIAILQDDTGSGLKIQSSSILLLSSPLIAAYLSILASVLS